MQSSYLEHSDYVDWQHAAIQAQAQVLAAGTTEACTIAQRCFLFVRDQIRHSVDHLLNPVTVHASEVLQHGTGFCFAKSHLLAALLRANGIAAGLCYQRLAGPKQSYFLHGLNAIDLPQYGWIRADARGLRPGLQATFAPPQATLPFTANAAGESDYPDIRARPCPNIIALLESCRTYEEVLAALPAIELSPAAHR